jgi:hypothetical protein
MRYYREQRRLELQGGRTELVTRRSSKQLIDGSWLIDVSWETREVVEQVPERGPAQVDCSA